MYRRQQREMATVAENPANHQFISRCAGYPVVASALQQVTGLYEKTKESNSLVKYTLETAESGVKVVTNTAMPVVNKFEKPIGSLDNFACNQLDKLEKTCPTITKPTEQVLEDSQEVYNKNLKPTVDKISGAYNYGVDKVTAVKDYSTAKVGAVKSYTQESVDSVVQFGKNKINDTTTVVKRSVSMALQSPTGQKVLGGVNTVIDTAEGYVDKYLPEEKKEEDGEEDEEEPMEVDSVDNEPGTVTMKRVSSLTSKMRRRMFTRAMKDMHHLQARSQETIQKLNFTVNLMEYARDHIDNAKTKVNDGYSATKERLNDGYNATRGRLNDGYTATRDRLNFYWEELNKTGEEVEMEDFSKDPEERENENKAAITPTTLELKALATARHLSMQLKHAMSTMSDRVHQIMPESVTQRFQSARAYTDDLYTQFSKADKLKELPQTFVAQTKEKLSYIQETLLFVVETYSPMSRVVPEKSQEGVDEGEAGGEEMKEDKKDN